MQAAGDVANQRTNAAQWGANAGMGLEGDIANRWGNTEQYLTDTGTGINQSMDRDAAARAAVTAATRFGQNTGVQDRQSQAWQNIGTARQGGQQQFRNWTTQQTESPADRALQYSGQRINAGSTAMGNVNNATGQWGDYDMSRRNSGFGAAFKTAAGKFLGSPNFSYSGGQ
jgi:hypothetical protein